MLHLWQIIKEFNDLIMIECETNDNKYPKEKFDKHSTQTNNNI